MDGAGVLVVIVIVIAIVLAYVGDQRSRKHIHAWGKANGLNVMSVRRLWFSRHWWWRTSDVQRLYEVQMYDGTSGHRIGHARVGGWFLGFLSSHVDIRWR